MLSELTLFFTILLAAAEPQPRSDAPFRVVVNRANGVSTVSRAELSALFMRRTRSWRDRSEVRPVEPPSRSQVREQFSRAIHGKSVAYVTRYWHRVIFAGRGVPPEELPNDAAVLEYVRTHRGAIGYVGPQTPINDGVKTVAVTP